MFQEYIGFRKAYYTKHSKPLDTESVCLTYGTMNAVSFYIPYSPAHLVWSDFINEISYVSTFVQWSLKVNSQTRQSFIPQYEKWQQSTFIFLS